MWQRVIEVSYAAWWKESVGENPADLALGEAGQTTTRITRATTGPVLPRHPVPEAALLSSSQTVRHAFG